jgi:hypothetical protein
MPDEAHCRGGEPFLIGSQNDHMKVTELAFTVNPVTDLKRARAFYEGVLKLEPGGDAAWTPLGAPPTRTLRHDRRCL